MKADPFAGGGFWGAAQVSSSLNYSSSVAKVITYYSELARPEFDERILMQVTKLYITYWTRRCARCYTSFSVCFLLLAPHLARQSHTVAAEGEG